VLFILVVGYYLLRMNFDDLLGIVSGAFGNPAILGYANQLAPTGRPSIVFGMTVPGVGVILKVIIAQVIVVVGASSVRCKGCYNEYARTKSKGFALKPEQVILAE
jgi:putative transport protein